MANNAIQKELEELRAQVDVLNQARDIESASKRNSDESEPSDRIQSSGSIESEHIPDQESDGSNEDIEKQLQKFIDALEEEIKDTNPMTVLVVFALGVLIGRLLPR